MTSSVLVCFILLVAYGTISVESQNCSVHKVEITCQDIDTNEWSVGELLTFYTDPSMTSTVYRSSISSVKYNNGSEVEMNYLAQIEALWISTAKVIFFPTGIVSKFPNLKLLAVTNSGLMSVNKENLKAFGIKLEELDLSDNNITSIDADLFEYNPNLKYISLYSLPLRYIEPEFFLNLRNLKGLKQIAIEISDTPGCINQIFNTVEGHDIALFKWKNANCTDETARIETEKLISGLLLSCD